MIESTLTLEDIYLAHEGKTSDKWSLYVTEYDKNFKNFRDLPINLLEIGIQNGGSLEIWSKYFPNASNIIGVDINPACASLIFEESKISVIAKDANQDETEKEIFSITPTLDFVIDDGSHISNDIIESFIRYFPHITDGGIYIAEDLHCSYWEDFEGGLNYPYSSMSFFQNLSDIINHEHWGISKTREDFIKKISAKFENKVDEDNLARIHSIEFVNSMCIIKKEKSEHNLLGKRRVVGTFAKIDCAPLGLNNSLNIPPNQDNNKLTKEPNQTAQKNTSIENVKSTDSGIEDDARGGGANAKRSLEEKFIEFQISQINGLKEIYSINQSTAEKTHFKNEALRNSLKEKEIFINQNTFECELKEKQLQLQLTLAHQKNDDLLERLANREKWFSETTIFFQKSLKEQAVEISEIHTKERQNSLTELQKIYEKNYSLLVQVESKKTFDAEVFISHEAQQQILQSKIELQENNIAEEKNKFEKLTREKEILADKLAANEGKFLQATAAVQTKYDLELLEHRSQLAQVQKNIDSLLLQLQEKEKSLSLQQAHDINQKQLYLDLIDEKSKYEQKQLDLLTKANKSNESLLTQLTEREKYFSNHLLELQKINTQDRVNQSLEFSKQKQKYQDQLTKLTVQNELTLKKLSDCQSKHTNEINDLLTYQKNENAHNLDRIKSVEELTNTSISELKATLEEKISELNASKEIIISMQSALAPTKPSYFQRLKSIVK